MTKSPIRIAFALVAVVAAVAGCTSSPPSSEAARSPRVERLIKRADLQPCPTTDPKAPAVSGGLPDVTLPCMGNGPAVDLAALRGMPTVVNIFETNCMPCQREAGSLSKVAAALTGKVRFLGIDAVDDEAPADALAYAMAIRPPAHYAMVNDSQGKALHAYGLGVPITLFVSPAGVVLGKHFGKFDSTTQLQAAIKQYLGVTT